MADATVLVVEDEPPVQDVLRAYLERTGQVAGAGIGLAAAE